MRAGRKPGSVRSFRPRQRRQLPSDPVGAPLGHGPAERGRKVPRQPAREARVEGPAPGSVSVRLA